MRWACRCSATLATQTITDRSKELGQAMADPIAQHQVFTEGATDAFLLAAGLMVRRLGDHLGSSSTSSTRSWPPTAPRSCPPWSDLTTPPRFVCGLAAVLRSGAADESCSGSVQVSRRPRATRSSDGFGPRGEAPARPQAGVSTSRSASLSRSRPSISIQRSTDLGDLAVGGDRRRVGRRYDAERDRLPRLERRGELVVVAGRELRRGRRRAPRRRRPGAGRAACRRRTSAPTARRPRR